MPAPVDVTRDPVRLPAEVHEGARREGPEIVPPPPGRNQGEGYVGMGWPRSSNENGEAIAFVAVYRFATTAPWGRQVF